MSQALTGNARAGVAAPDQAGARVTAIDVLRGLCAVLVVLHHIHINFRLRKFDVGALLPLPAVRVVFGSGYYAVIVFFVVSGFLITALSLRRWGTAPAIALREFYALRAARILPCLLLVLALLSVLHLLRLPGFVIDPERSSLGRALVAAFGMHVNWLEGRHGYLPGGWDVLWSLSIEEAFYLGFPLACVALRKEGWLVLPLVSLVAIGPVNRMLTAGQIPWEDYAYLSCLDGIAFGCLAALAAARVRLSDGVRLACVLAGGAAVVLVMGFRSWTVAIGLVEWGLNVSVLQFGVALLLLGQLPERAGRRVHRITRPLQYVGCCSYEIYLSHMFVVTWATQAFGTLRLGSAWLGAWYSLELLASLAIGAALARLYSAPLNRALRARWRGGASGLGRSRHAPRDRDTAR